MRFSSLIFIYALILLLDGIIFQIIAPARDTDILYPAFLGGLILLMGFITLKKDFRIFAKHGATALSLVAFITSVTDFSEWIQNLRTSDYAQISNSIMAILSLVFLILAVRQFAKERSA
jgi:hypothetical protein